MLHNIWIVTTVAGVAFAFLATEPDRLPQLSLADGHQSENALGKHGDSCVRPGWTARQPSHEGLIAPDKQAWRDTINKISAQFTESHHQKRAFVHKVYDAVENARGKPGPENPPSNSGIQQKSREDQISTQAQAQALNSNIIGSNIERLGKAEVKADNKNGNQPPDAKKSKEPPKNVTVASNAQKTAVDAATAELRRKYKEKIDFLVREQCWGEYNISLCKCKHPFKWEFIWGMMRSGKRNYGEEAEPNFYKRFAKVIIGTCKAAAPPWEEDRGPCDHAEFVDCSVPTEPPLWAPSGPVWDIKTGKLIQETE